MTPLSKTQDQQINNFTPLFYPKSIAIIGASKNKLGGSKFLMALQSSGYINEGGKVYLINPKFKDLFGLPVFPDLKDNRIPKLIDLAIIAVSAKYVPSIVRECDGICKFAVIYTSGFGESGNISLDKELKTAISSVDTRFIGPNGLGVLNPYSKLAIYPKWGQYKGHVSYVAQSGGTIRIYDVCGTNGNQQEAFDVKSSASQINVTGGTLEILPTTGTGLADAGNYRINSTAPIYNLLIDRISSASVVQLRTTPLTVLDDLTLSSGDFSANNLDVTIGGDFSIASGTSYSPGNNTTFLNGTDNQTLTVNLSAPLSFNMLTIDKPSGIVLDLDGSQNTMCSYI